MDERREQCLRHDELIEQLCKDVHTLMIDTAIVKERVLAVDKRVNGSIDDIKEHIEHGSKWRLAIVGLASLIIAGVFWAGNLTEKISDNYKEIEELRQHKEIKEV